MRWLAIALLTGCTYTLPPGMAVSVTGYHDTGKLFDVCGLDSYGRPAKACVVTDYKTFCDMHLPYAANGDYLEYTHEESHCAGREDAPPIGYSL